MNTKKEILKNLSKSVQTRPFTKLKTLVGTSSWLLNEMKNNLAIFSSLLFLIPAYFSAEYKLYWHFTILILVILFSIRFHFSGEKNFVRTDKFLAILLMIGNLYLLYLGKFHFFYTSLAIVFVLMAFFFFKREKINYPLNHSLWHLSSIIITLLCIFASQA